MARRFFVSATTLKFGFWSFCLFASTVDCIRLLKHLLGVCSETVVFLGQQSPSQDQDNIEREE